LATNISRLGGHFGGAQSASPRGWRGGNDDERHRGIRNGSRRYVAALLRADDATAEPSRNRRPSREGFTDAGNYGGGGDGGSISSWFGGDNSALDSSGNPSSDSSGGGDGGGSDGGGD